jgi:sugar (pentulose or hexulose) kinase
MAADIFQRELSCLKIKDASSMGAIVLALLAVKAISDISDIPEECKAASMVYPRKEFADYYLEQYNRYKYWYEKTK